MLTMDYFVCVALHSRRVEIFRLKNNTRSTWVQALITLQNDKLDISLIII
jgi:hypothetical protein